MSMQQWFVCVFSLVAAAVLTTGSASALVARPHSYLSAQSGSCAGFSESCCTQGSCYVAGCFCDSICHENNDCCSDIGCAAPPPPTPAPVTTCAAFGLSNGCCTGFGFDCYVPDGECFCDSGCNEFTDCCDDVDHSLCAPTDCASAGLLPGCCSSFTSDSCAVSPPMAQTCHCDSMCFVFGDCCSDVDPIVALSCPFTTSQSPRQNLLRAQAQRKSGALRAQSHGHAQQAGRPSLQTHSAGRGKPVAEFDMGRLQMIGSDVLNEIRNFKSQGENGATAETNSASRDDVIAQLKAVLAEAGHTKRQPATAASQEHIHQRLGNKALSDQSEEVLEAVVQSLVRQEGAQRKADRVD